MKKAVTELSGRWLDSERWALLLSGYEKSKQSVKDYCASQGISAASYYRWQKRFQRDKASAGGLFSPIEIEAKSTGSILVELPGSVVVRFEELPPVEYLQRLSSQFSGG